MCLTLDYQRKHEKNCLSLGLEWIGGWLPNMTYLYIYIYLYVHLVIYKHNIYIYIYTYIHTSISLYPFFAWPCNLDPPGATGSEQYIAGLQSAVAGGFASALIGLKDLWASAVVKWSPLLTGFKQWHKPPMTGNGEHIYIYTYTYIRWFWGWFMALFDELTGAVHAGNGWE